MRSLRRRSAPVVVIAAAPLLLAGVSAAPVAAAPGCGTQLLAELDRTGPSTDMVFFGADVVSPTDGFFAGSLWATRQYPAVFRWNGTSLVREPVRHADVGADAELDDVVALGHGDAWAMGTWFTVKGAERPLLRHRVNGIWREVRPPAADLPASLEGGMDGSGQSNVWAVGRQGYYDRPLVLRWNGTSWREVRLRSITGATEQTAWGVDVVSRRNVWIAGNVLKGGTNSVFVDHWNGTAFRRTWLPQIGTDDYVNAVAYASATNIWVAGSTTADGSTFQPALWHWDGTSWAGQAVALPAGQSDAYLEDAVVVGGRLLAVGYSFGAAKGSVVIRSTGVGTTVTYVDPTGLGSTAWAAGVAEGTNVAVAAGQLNTSPGVAWVNCS